MTKNELIKELKLLDDGDLEPTYERIADYFLSHTEELRKENEELKEYKKQNSVSPQYWQLAKEVQDLEIEKDRLKALVSEWYQAKQETNKCTELLLSSGCSEKAHKIMQRFIDAENALAKIAEFKEGNK